MPAQTGLRGSDLDETCACGSAESQSGWPSKGAQAGRGKSRNCQRGRHVRESVRSQDSQEALAGRRVTRVHHSGNPA